MNKYFFLKIILLSFLVLVGQSCKEKMVHTPFGVIPSKCHVQHPPGTTLKVVNNTVHATHSDGTIVIHESSPDCLKHVKSLRKAPHAPGAESIISNGWFNYASWYTPSSQNVGEFTATYTLPNFPSNPGSQNIYYFIGVQDNNQSNPLTILQPVIGYNQIGGTGWTLSSWNCCPNGQVHQGNVVSGMGPGETILASIKQTSQSPSTYTITGTWQGQNANLTVEVGQEFFNWPNVTLEAYNINSCNQFMNGPFTFSALSLKDTNGNPLNPTWALSPPGGKTACNGQLTVSGSTITIQENIP